MAAEYTSPQQQQVLQTQKLNADLKKRPNVRDPFPIYKGGETRTVHGVDFPAWERQGWSREPQPDQPQTPPELTGDGQENLSKFSAYDTRKAELGALLKEGGWQAIANIAKPLNITKPKGGWDDSIELILTAEGLTP
jgi:hypothetical protein